MYDNTAVLQGFHFLENQRMLENYILTGMSGNFAVCWGILLLLLKLMICICNWQ